MIFYDPELLRRNVAVVLRGNELRPTEIAAALQGSYTGLRGLLWKYLWSGSLYPVLMAMEHAGEVATRWGVSAAPDGPRPRLYRLVESSK